MTMGRTWITPAMCATLAAAALMPGSLAAQQNARVRDAGSRIDTTLALAADGTVDLNLVSGRITVTSWNQNQVKIRAVSDRGILQLDATPSRVGLSVRSSRGDMGDTRYDVTIPAGARVITRSISGDIETRGGGDVEAHSVSGEITMSEVAGRATIEAVSGDVRVSRVGRGVRATGVSGDLRLADITGDVDVRTVSGDVELDGVRSSFVRAGSTSGDIRFSGALDAQGRYELNSHSGDITLRIPQTGATFTVQTFSGEVQSDYQMTIAPGSQGRRQRMQFTINGGGARVSAETFSGDIIIQRASGAKREN
jgi:DUF4097 and DUF4098 domain-containing protein YvlB